MKDVKQLIKDAKEGKLTKEDIERIKCSVRFWNYAEDELYPLLGDLNQNHRL